MKWFVIISICLFLIACGNQSQGVLEKDIVKYIEKRCMNKNHCTIELSDVTHFVWTKLYVFKETAGQDEIEEVLGIKYPYFTDVAKRLVFLDSEGNIIYHEDVFPNVEKINNKQVVFDMSDNSNYISFDRSLFNVEKRTIEKGYYYLLSQ